MIFSENNKPTIEKFESLCFSAEKELNRWVGEDRKFFKNKTAQKLEPVVLEAFNKVAKNTPFENTLSLVSGLKFPDILVNKFYGVEVKSTKEDQWKVIGGSVAEGTRIDTVENIFIMFGKMHDPISFKTRRYQDCLYDIAVTHSPRYKIDMELKKGETIFDKIGVEYDVLRKEENPLDEVVNYYRSTLKPGERLWWINGAEAENKAIPVKIRLWKNLATEEKELLKIKALAYFPEIFSKNNKYEKFILWLVSEYGVISTSMRDTFTAGGKIAIRIGETIYKDLPRIFLHIVKHKEKISRTILSTDSILLKEYWGNEKYKENVSPLENWIELVSCYAENRIVYLMLRKLFVENKSVYLNYEQIYDRNLEVKEVNYSIYGK